MSSQDEKLSQSMQRFIDTWEGKGLGKGRCRGEVGDTHRHEQEYCDLWAQKEEELDRANRWEATAAHLRAAWIKEKERGVEKDAEIERLKANLGVVAEHLQTLYMKSASAP